MPGEGTRHFDALMVSRRPRCYPTLTPDRSSNLGLVRVLERAIKEAKADLKPSDWE